MAEFGCEIPVTIRNIQTGDVGQVLDLFQQHSVDERVADFEVGSIELAFRAGRGARELARVITGLELAAGLVEESSEFFCQVAAREDDGRLIGLACAEAPEASVFSMWQGAQARRGFEDSRAMQELEVARRNWAVGVGRVICSRVDASAWRQKMDMKKHGFILVGAMDAVIGYEGVLHVMQISRNNLKLGIDGAD